MPLYLPLNATLSSASSCVRLCTERQEGRHREIITDKEGFIERASKPAFLFTYIYLFSTSLFFLFIYLFLFIFIYSFYLFFACEYRSPLVFFEVYVVMISVTVGPGCVA